MNQKATFYDLQWFQSNTTLVQGVKNGRRPSKAYGGSKGSFIKPVCSPKLELYLQFDGGVFMCKNIYYDVKKVLNKRITFRLRERMSELFQNTIFEVDANGNIVNFEEILLMLKS